MPDNVRGNVRSANPVVYYFTEENLLSASSCNTNFDCVNHFDKWPTSAGKESTLKSPMSVIARKRYPNHVISIYLH